VQHSDGRILTTHTGSLPRGEALERLLIAQEAGQAVDGATLAGEVDAAVQRVIRHQAAAGVDIANNGEQPRVGFQTYVAQRMAGFGGESTRASGLDFKNYPDWAAMVAATYRKAAKIRNAPQAVAEVRYDDLTPIVEEVDQFLARAEGQDFSELFVNAPSPGIIATTLHNAYYASHEDYVMALAREIGKEYQHIVSRGLLLQIDAPDLAMERTVMFQDKSLAEFQAMTELHVAAINRALGDIPPERVRLHACWGNWHGPHDSDVPLADVLPLLYQARVGGLSIPFANPAHAHELSALREHPLPPEMLLLPGVIDPTTAFVEHPQVVAQRLEEAARAVGDPTRIVASTDCGFGTFAGYGVLTADVVWAKLAAMRKGADIASGRLWG